jgi:RNA polymerase sigma-70 factor, ECF subfamily
MADEEPDDRLAWLVHDHYRRVLAYLCRRIGDRHAAEELAAETFVVAWRRLPDVPTEPLPWLYRVARGLLLNEYRRTARRQAAEARAGDAGRPSDDPADRVPEADRVVRALAGLSERDRELLMLIGWEGLTVAQAATVLEMPSPAVSVRLYRARRRLARLLTELDRVASVNVVEAPELRSV